ncbi:MAG: TIGR03084 family metal-binding protein [Mycobacteriales bacterium]
MDLQPLLADLRAEQADLRQVIEGADISTPTPAAGWDVRDCLSHLAATDVEATLSLTDPDQFIAKLPMIATDIEGFLTDQLTARKIIPQGDFLDQWETGFERMLTAFADVELDAKLPWYGPPMSPASFATARLMEYWAHGQDVADGLGVDRVPTARLRHICHLGFRTRGFAYVNRGLQAPAADVLLRLSAPDGATWQYGSVDAPGQVTGSAHDFALLVTQRRHRDDVDLRATGDAEEWLRIAQCFAGPPGSGRARR